MVTGEPALLRLFFIYRPGGKSFFFFFNDTATTEIYTLSLHDALPILSMPPKVSTALATAAAVCSSLRMYTRSEEHTSELQSQSNLVCRLLLEKKKKEPYVDVDELSSTAVSHTRLTYSRFAIISHDTVS